jgi:acetyltransferase-like isoleucine patch superfamily enzyme
MRAFLELFVKLLPFIPGFRFFHAFSALRDNLISYSLQRQIENRDNDIWIQAPAVIKGAKYITVGKSFVANRNLRLQAITDYMGIRYEPQITIGNNVKVNPNCHIAALKKTTIGIKVLIANNVFICDYSHGRLDFSDIAIPPALRQLDSKGEIHIGNNVWVGQNIAILANVNVCDNVIIGANTLVANSIVVGNPARVIRSINI